MLSRLRNKQSHRKRSPERDSARSVRRGMHENADCRGRRVDQHDPLPASMGGWPERTKRSPAAAYSRLNSSTKAPRSDGRSTPPTIRSPWYTKPRPRLPCGVWGTRIELDMDIFRVFYCNGNREPSGSELGQGCLFEKRSRSARGGYADRGADATPLATFLLGARDLLVQRIKYTWFRSRMTSSSPGCCLASTVFSDGVFAATSRK
jgi:hypothetical protein